MTFCGQARARLRPRFFHANSVVRQRAIETIVGEEISNMTLSKKSVADTAKSAEERVNKLLSSVK